MRVGNNNSRINSENERTEDVASNPAGVKKENPFAEGQKTLTTGYSKAFASNSLLQDLQPALGPHPNDLQARTLATSLSTSRPASEAKFEKLSDPQEASGAHEDYLKTLKGLSGYREGEYNGHKDIARQFANASGPLGFMGQSGKKNQFYAAKDDQKRTVGLMQLRVQPPALEVAHVTATKGNGKLFIEKAEQVAKQEGLQKITLTAADKGVAGFYRKHGFEMETPGAESGKMFKVLGGPPSNTADHRAAAPIPESGETAGPPKPAGSGQKATPPPVPSRSTKPVLSPGPPKPAGSAQKATPPPVPPRSTKPVLSSGPSKPAADTRGTEVVSGEAGRVTGSRKAPSDLQTEPELEAKGSGMDKQYWYGKGDKQGFLQFKSSDAAKNQATMDRELDAYHALHNIIPGNLPKIDQEKPAPRQLEGKQGYWVENIPHDQTFKPKMQRFATSNGLNQSIEQMTDVQKGNLDTSLREIQAKLPQISQHVGELSIAVHKDSGKAYLLDYAPNESGDVGGEDLEKISNTGIDNVLNSLAKLRAK
jgi:hypothetical protein